MSLIADLSTVTSHLEGTLTDYNLKCNRSKKEGQYAAQGVQ